MKIPSPEELAEFKRRQARLETEVSLLRNQLSDIESRLRTARAQAVAAPEDATTSLEERPDISEPVAPEMLLVPPVIPVHTAAPVASTFPSAAVGIPVSTAASGSGVSPDTYRQALGAEEPASAQRVPGSFPGDQTAEPEPAAAGSFEMRLGTYWLVRIGIVLVLTALAFFGNYAYQNFITRLGAGGKLALLYLASGALLGLGAWWQRASVKPALKNYGQVLFAGGLASVYFTTYAAHYVPNLKVIGSATLAGTLLLAWASFIVWIADRRKSEVLALFAIGLAYYTSVMTRVGDFTLYSNLLLAAAAVFFLVRNRWAGLSTASLVATYAAYGFWRFLDGAHFRWATPEEGLWKGAIFLMCYWALFTAAVFLARNTRVAGEYRAGFATLNNGLFFGLFLLTMLQVREGGFWKFAMIYGAVLLALAALARRLLSEESLTANAYLTQGLLLFTLGLITKYAGLQLSLMLGVESVILLSFGLRRKHAVLTAGAYVCAVLAVGWCIDGMRQFDRNGLLAGLALGALMLVNAYQSHRAQPREPNLLRIGPAAFSALGLIAFGVSTWNNSSKDLFPVLMVAQGALLLLSMYPARVQELSLLAKAPLAIGQVACLVNIAGHAGVPWWSPVLVLAITLALLHWREAASVLDIPAGVTRAWQGLNSALFVLTLFFWLAPKYGPSQWLALASVIAAVLTAYGVGARIWALAGCAQFFTLVAGFECARQLAMLRPNWALALLPIGLLWALALGAFEWFRLKPEALEHIRRAVLGVATAYQWAGVLLFLGWLHEFIPAPYRVAAYVLVGVLVFGLSGALRSGKALVFAAVFWIASLAAFWSRLQGVEAITVLNLLSILALIGLQRVGRRLPERFLLNEQAHTAMMTAAVITLLAFVTRWVTLSGDSSYLTAAWSLLALVLFVFGIFSRERIYRWAGLAILGCALGRIIVFDVWKLQVLLRVLSFLALGIALLVLGFIYNKYQEKLREWL